MLSNPETGVQFRKPRDELPRKYWVPEDYKDKPRDESLYYKDNYEPTAMNERTIEFDDHLNLIRKELGSVKK